jgi:hypothetical protein
MGPRAASRSGCTFRKNSFGELRRDRPLLLWMLHNEWENSTYARPS